MPIEQVLSSYGMQLHGKRCKCPVHHGEHLSASVYNNKLHCFKCNQSWDAVALVAELDKLSPVDAAKQINDQYFLGLTIGRAATPEERSRQQEAAAQRRERQELAHAFQNWKQYAWIIYSAYYRQLRQWKEVYAPASIEVHRHPLFIEALQRLDYISYCLDILDRGTDEQQLQFYRTHRIEVKNIESRIIGRHEQRRTGATA